MGIVLDLIIAAVIIIEVVISARRGFARVAIELVGFIAAILLTFTISTPLSQATYDKIIEPSFVSTLDTALKDSSQNATEAAWNALPDIVKKHSDKLGVSKEKIETGIAENAGNAVQDAAEGISQRVVKPVAVKFLSLMFGVILMAVFIFIVKILAKFINRLFSISLVGKLNRLLGAVVGLPKGIIVALLLCSVVALAVSFTQNGIWIFTSENMKNSWFFGVLAGKYI